ncbi:hypothetical protein H0H10_29110 [Streptomyces sp. TRM S81-3]|uniref:Extensin n=1 Tax=Streptomyces griseicoloratus TaxID=2752516 RepID=A0A926L715_9ACTN|nr:hypothetical protein [Streptomyces griseicoloratus]MBD0423170.1 hypothetical protein [Streptomyces griseicoloratus]
MADEQDSWLDRETAELLLRGQSPEAVDPAVRDRAERLARALHTLSSPPPPTSGELPGEAAALAAFRKVRAERAGRPDAVPGGLGRDTGVQPADAGLVRIGGRGDRVRRSRWGRPARFGLAAALTAGMVGGVAVAAGTGVLPTPFGGAEPAPAATVSATTPDRPLASAPDGERGGSTPDGAATAPSGRGDARDEAGGGTATGRDPGADDRSGDVGGRRQSLAASCRDVRAGERLDGARRRALTEAAGGASRVWTYCEGVLAGTGRDGDGSGSGMTGEGGDAAGNREPRKDTTGEDAGAGKDAGGGTGGQDGRADGNGGNGEDDAKGEDARSGDEGRNGDDDGHHLAPQSQEPSEPEGSSTYAPLKQERPRYAPQSSSSSR